MTLGLAAFALLLLVLPLSFWALSAQKSNAVVRLLVAGANLCLTSQLLLRSSRAVPRSVKSTATESREPTSRAA